MAAEASSAAGSSSASSSASKTHCLAVHAAIRSSLFLKSTRSKAAAKAAALEAAAEARKAAAEEAAARTAPRGKGAAAKVHYTRATGGLTANDFYYGSVFVREPPVQAALGVIPAFKAAWDKHGPENLGKAGIVHRPHLDGTGDAPLSTRRFLPLHLRLPGIAVGA